jgi:hypothetical protein
MRTKRKARHSTTSSSEMGSLLAVSTTGTDNLVAQSRAMRANLNR